MGSGCAQGIGIVHGAELQDPKAGLEPGCMVCGSLYAAASGMVCSDVLSPDVMVEMLVKTLLV